MANNELFKSSSAVIRNRPTERIMVQVTNYDLAKTTGFVSGVNLATGAEIKVRLNSIEERLSDRPGQKRTAVENSYSTGSFKRESMVQKFQKKASVLQLDDCVALNDGKNTEYRAHWPKTIATETQNVTVLHSNAVHLKLFKNNSDAGKDLAFVEVVKPSVKLTAEICQEVLMNAFANVDENENPHRPVVLLDMRHNGTPIFDNVPRLYPSTVADSVYDDSIGGMKEIRVTADAKVSVDDLLSGNRKPADGREATHLDYFRAAIAAVLNEPMPELTSPSATVTDRAQQLYNLIEEGKVEVNIGSASIYNFGPQSAKTYLADADKKHLTAYSVSRKGPNDSTVNVSGYTEAYVSLGQFEDGTFYARDVVSVEPYPKAKPLNEFNLTALKEPEIKYQNKINNEPVLDMEEPYTPSNDNSGPSM